MRWHGSFVPQPDSCTAAMTKRCPHSGRPAAYKARVVISSQSFGPEPRGRVPGRRLVSQCTSTTVQISKYDGFRPSVDSQPPSSHPVRLVMGNALSASNITYLTVLTEFLRKLSGLVPKLVPILGRAMACRIFLRFHFSRSHTTTRTTYDAPRDRR